MNGSEPKNRSSISGNNKNLSDCWTRSYPDDLWKMLEFVISKRRMIRNPHLCAKMVYFYIKFSSKSILVDFCFWILNRNKRINWWYSHICPRGLQTVEGLLYYFKVADKLHKIIVACSRKQCSQCVKFSISSVIPTKS